jgi:hypothetical protein
MLWRRRGRDNSNSSDEHRSRAHRCCALHWQGRKFTAASVALKPGFADWVIECDRLARWRPRGAAAGDVPDAAVWMPCRPPHEVSDCLVESDAVTRGAPAPARSYVGLALPFMVPSLSGTRAGSNPLCFRTFSGASVRGLLLVGAMLASNALTSTALAQTMVSNLDATVNGTSNTASNQTLANSFTTGASATNLSSVTLFMANNTGGSGFAVNLYSDGSGAPGSALESLSGPGAPSTNGNYNYTSAGTLLNANSTYWIVATSSVDHFGWGQTSSTTETSSSGWTIGDVGLASTNGGASWITNTSNVQMFSVSTTAIPEPGTYAALAGVVALGFAAWRRRRV